MKSIKLKEILSHFETAFRLVSQKKTTISPRERQYTEERTLSPIFSPNYKKKKITEEPKKGVSANDTPEKFAALKERNREKIARKRLNKFDEEVVRLIGQHLEKLGLQ